MIHVICNGRWKVYRKGATQALKSTKDKAEAIQFGNRIALETLDELTVHCKDGSVDFTLDYKIPKLYVKSHPTT